MDNNTDETILYGVEAKPFDNLDTAISEAEAGDSEMCYSLASYFTSHEEKAENGNWKVIKRDIDKAVQWAERCAALGNSNGFASLGYLYSSDEAALKKHRDMAKAIDYYRQGSEMGNFHCSYMLANILSGNMSEYYDEFPSNRDFFEIRKSSWKEAQELYFVVYEKLRNDDYRAEVAAKIASCYVGLGEEPDKALEWYRKGYEEEYSDEINVLTALIKSRNKVKELAHKPTESKARSLANEYYNIVSMGGQWLDPNEYSSYCQAAKKWNELLMRNLEDELKLIKVRLEWIESSASLINKIRNS